MSPLLINSKLPNVGTTIFTIMNALSVKHNAINLGQGFPDFMMNAKLIALVNEAMQSGHNQYVHMNGVQHLRENLCEKMDYLYGATINADSEITITPGGTYAIYTALTSVLHPGDEVIVFEPAYDSYLPNILINGAIPVTIPLTYPEYSIDWELVKSRLTSKTKMIILNNPHNPTGSVLNRNDIIQLSALVKDTNIFILSDEVYEHLIFDDKEHQSILRYPDLLQRSFICFSFGKTYHCTGWKMGYCVAPAELMNEFRKVHQYNCFSCNSAVQVALAQFMVEKEVYLQLGKEIQLKRDQFQLMMQQTKFKALPTYGGYFQLYSYAGLSEASEQDMAIRLIKEFGVTTIPVAAFYSNKKDDKVLRFCFVKNENTLNEAVNRLMKF